MHFKINSINKTFLHPRLISKFGWEARNLSVMRVNKEAEDCAPTGSQGVNPG